MPLLFAITLFLSAALLFSVQPMIARLLLPLLGGAPGVWSTCMVFYQVVLLLGYLYAHFASRHFSRALQSLVQLALLAAAFLVLPFAVSEDAMNSLRAGAPPVGWLLLTLLLVVGLPFFIVSTTGPLLQRWFSRIQHRDSGDPYFLYSASNAGSLLALAAYPLWLETRFELVQQAGLWRWSFGALLLLSLGCAIAFLRRGDGLPVPTQVESTPAITGKQRLSWVWLAFVPSSLMLGLTTYLTTDIASIPLLWVIPLMLYLLTFVLVFARRTLIPPALVHRTMPIVTIVLVFTILCRATEPTWFLLGIHLLFFFVAAMVCHGRLAADRPPASRLTEFYLWMSVGGALGGLFNGIAAPMVFREVHEYPMAIVAAAGLYFAPAMTRPLSQSVLRRWWPVAAVALLAVAFAFIAGKLGLTPGLLTHALVFGIPVVLCFALTRRPLQFAAAIALVMVAAQIYVELNKRTVFVDRSFFGVSRVTRLNYGPFHSLSHGNTTHGRQFLDPARACEPLTYYHRSGPLGTIFTEFNRTNTAPLVGVIGLGAGSSLAYAQPGQEWDIFEIDPLVIRIARTPALFTYLSRCSAVRPRVIEGDGRLQLAAVEPGRYGLLMLDAFSSDAIPVHLLTAEAVELYFSRIASGGWLVLHVSNRYLDLEQVIAGLAAEQGYAGLSWIDTTIDLVAGKDESHWIVLARAEEDLRGLTADPNRLPIENRPAAAPWTDARSSLLPVFKW